MRSAISVLCLAVLGACGPKLDSEGRPITVGRLRLRTYPSGARVWIDGELKVESTPATLVLPAGRYRLTIQLTGAEALEREVNLDAGDVRELDLDLPRPPPAQVTVLSDAIGSKVLINGYTRGETPLVDAVTKPGPLDVTIHGPLGRARSLRSWLEIGEQKRIEIFFGDVASEPPVEEPRPPPMSMPPQLGRVTIGLEPEGEVFDEEEKLLGKTPLESYPLPVGEHRLRLRSKDGRYEKWVIVEVEAGKAMIYRFRLREEDRQSSR